MPQADDLMAIALRLFGRDSEVFSRLACKPALLGDFLTASEATLFADAGELTPGQRFLVARAVALHGGAGGLDVLFASSGGGDDPDADRDDLVALIAANAGYNTLYKFRGLTAGRFDEFPARFKLKTFRTTRFDLATVELLSVVVSSLNACQPCVAAHTKKAKDRGLTYAAIDEAVQIAAAVSIAAGFLKTTVS
ncbi:MAG: carboxymuconolactone decarboxylase family protein [Planctomycetota bacterium]